ncbi:hypothetical protein N658DRAFT_491889 [Parathielavia hyrcaniae]|uniref:Uncharacterized protein n=1 Tax=Parathielavia hyrcaniae TaxID=113614 RepID=A0AAN6T5X2_9PEZI|nr:hypothetical protein N658DRAFT_491889 [Parathielavia hyrcaniae]
MGPRWLSPGICGYQWCYICLEPYALFEGQGQKRIRLCRHKPSCPGHGPLLPPMGRTAGAMDRSPPRPAPDRAAGLYRGRQAGGVGARRWRHATADRFAREA